MNYENTNEESRYSEKERLLNPGEHIARQLQKITALFGSRNMFIQEAIGEPSSSLSERNINADKYVAKLLTEYRINPKELEETEKQASTRDFLSEDDVRGIITGINVVRAGDHWEIFRDTQHQLEEKTAMKIMGEIEQRVKQEAPYWHQSHTEFGFSPLDTDLNEEQLKKKYNIKFGVGNAKPKDIYDLFLHLREAEGMSLAKRIRMKDTFPSIHKRLLALFTTDAPKPFSPPDRLPATIDISDQTGLDITKHEIVHTAQEFMIPLPIIDTITAILHRKRLHPGISEAQAYQAFGMPLAFTGEQNSAEMIAYFYLGGTYIEREIKNNPNLAERFKAMNQTEKETFTIEKYEEYLRDDPEGEIKKTLAATTAIDRLYTIEWLQARKALQQGERPAPAHERIGALVRKSHYNKHTGWLELNKAIEIFLRKEYGVTTQQELDVAMASLDVVRDLYHQEQRIEFYKVKSISQEQLAKQAVETFGLSENLGTAVINQAREYVYEQDINSILSQLQPYAHERKHNALWKIADGYLEHVHTPDVHTRIKQLLDTTYQTGMSMRQSKGENTSTEISLLTPTHTALRNELVAGDISADDFLDKLLELDQKNKDLPTYEGNVRLLEDPQTITLVENLKNPYIQHTYLDRLAFFRYHQAQHKAGSGDTRASIIFDKAIEDKLKARLYLMKLLVKPGTDENLQTFIHGIVDEDTGDSLFTLYMQANAAYMNKQSNDLERYYNQLLKLAPEMVNTKIVGNLLKGLKERTLADYSADHHP